ncbi:MAG: hypothetical protein ABS75_12285 [Pelagibacterium sp. SCN 63-23]|nr:MAG: hypothetical protein ABS75_12285 [Pelagibacterium sp. SCN 63-23]
MIKELFASFAVVALFVAIWALSQEWIRSWPRTLRMYGAGLYMGVAAVVSMIMSVPFASGIIFDLRNVVLGLAGLFAGPVAAVLAAGIAAAYRLSLGGAGIFAGHFSIFIGCLSGILAFYLRSKLSSWRWSLGVFCSMQAMLPMVALLALPAEVRAKAIDDALLPLVVLNLAASSLAAIGIEVSRRRGWLSHLLKSAIKQAPDYFYIKDRNSRVVLANAHVASIAGAPSVESLIGKTDFDFSDAERAKKLFDQEQEIMRTNTAVIDEEEAIALDGKDIRTFVTTKTPIRNADGSVSGLVGVTKDLTERLALERRLRETQNELDVVLTGMSDGLARFDAKNTLVFSNGKYQNLFPLTGSIRQPGAKLETILDAVIRTREQLYTADASAWKNEILKRTRLGGEEQVQMSDGRWLRIRTQPLDDGGAVVIVSDVTALKRSEMELMGVAEQFKVLASTDPLTGLRNRRDFDQSLEELFGRDGKARAGVGLLMVDIDHFKAYNDLYGHPAGDACIRMVAECIANACGRATDVAARYGGEEFGIVLPGTDMDGSMAVASEILSAVTSLAIPHKGSPHGLVSVSIGVASIGGQEMGDSQTLLRHADKALYAAKEAGRSQIKAAA